MGAKGKFLVHSSTNSNLDEKALRRVLSRISKDNILQGPKSKSFKTSQKSKPASQPGESREAKAFYKQAWFWILAVVVILTIVGGIIAYIKCGEKPAEPLGYAIV